MIKIDTLFEFRKGILFVRLRGVINNVTCSKYNEEVISLIKNNGIKNVVLNFEKVYKIDLKGINSLFYTYEIIKQNNGKLMFSNINDLIKKRIENSHILRYIKILDNEIDSFNEIIV